MNKLSVLSLCLGSLVSLSAFAGPFADVKAGNPVCFEREYSGQHMQTHPKQTVKEMKIKLYRGTEEYDSETLYLAVEAQVKKPGAKDYKPYSSGLACFEEGGSLKCTIDCDGGSLNLRPSVQKPEGWVRLENNGFVLYGGCGSEVNEEDSIWLAPTKGGDDLFLLKKMDDKKACEAIKGWDAQ